MGIAIIQLRQHTVIRVSPYTRTASASVPADISPGIDIIKTVQERNYSTVGTVLHYTIVVTNTGNVTLSNITVTDPLTNLRVTIPSLAPGVPYTINETHTITLDDINSGRVDNTARVTVSYGEPHIQMRQV